MHAFFALTRLDDHRTAHTLIYRHIKVEILADVQSVAGGLLQGLVTANGGDTKQINVWVFAGHHDGDGIIMPRITIENDLLLCHDITPLLINRFGKYILNI